jgi:hypothetical protein
LSIEASSNNFAGFLMNREVMLTERENPGAAQIPSERSASRPSLVCYIIKTPTATKKVTTLRDLWSRGKASSTVIRPRPIEETLEN